MDKQWSDSFSGFPPFLFFLGFGLFHVIGQLIWYRLLMLVVYDVTGSMWASGDSHEDASNSYYSSNLEWFQGIPFSPTSSGPSLGVLSYGATRKKVNPYNTHPLTAGAVTDNRTQQHNSETRVWDKQYILLTGFGIQVDSPENRQTILTRRRRRRRQYGFGTQVIHP